MPRFTILLMPFVLVGVLENHRPARQADRPRSFDGHGQNVDRSGTPQVIATHAVTALPVSKVFSRQGYDESDFR